LRSSETSFKWCSSGAGIGESIWSFEQPNNANNSENCAQMVIHKNNSTFTLDDRFCGVVSAFACQVIEIFILHNKLMLFSGAAYTKTTLFGANLSKHHLQQECE
jgi:hypothetical protein